MICLLHFATGSAWTKSFLWLLAFFELTERTCCFVGLWFFGGRFRWGFVCLLVCFRWFVLFFAVPDMTRKAQNSIWRQLKEFAFKTWNLVKVLEPHKSLHNFLRFLGPISQIAKHSGHKPPAITEKA